MTITYILSIAVSLWAPNMHIATASIDDACYVVASASTHDAAWKAATAAGYEVVEVLPVVDSDGTYPDGEAFEPARCDGENPELYR